MRMHTQNLNERPGQPDGSIIRHGRAWLYGDSHSSLAHAEWVVFTRHFHFNFDLGGRGDDDMLGVSVACGLFAFWLIINPPRLHARLLKFFRVEDYEDRTFSLSFHDRALYWNLWTPSMEWDKKKHGRRQGAFDPLDFIFGRTKYSEIPISEHVVEIPMPEGPYKATVKMAEARWRRPRWPFIWTRLRRAEVTPLMPIPFPGKGENSWDCGEDATHSMTCGAETVDEAIGKMVASVMRDRRRNGGENWRPQAVAAQ